MGWRWASGVTSRGAECAHRSTGQRRVLQRHHRQHLHLPCPQRGRSHTGGAADAIPHDGRVERRVLLGVEMRERVKSRYNLPSARVLKKQGTRYSLTVPFSTPIEKVDVRELTVRVILPECVKNVKFSLPEGVEQSSESRRYTYLDSSFEGRHVYEFKQNNLIGLHSSETITVSYDLNPLMLWREPLMCVGAFFCLFFVKAVVRVLTRNAKEKRD